MVDGMEAGGGGAGQRWASPEPRPVSCLLSGVSFPRFCAGQGSGTLGRAGHAAGDAIISYGSSFYSSVN